MCGNTDGIRQLPLPSKRMFKPEEKETGAMFTANRNGSVRSQDGDISFSASFFHSKKLPASKASTHRPSLGDFPASSSQVRYELTTRAGLASMTCPRKKRLKGGEIWKADFNAFRRVENGPVIRY
jgi:hypothetical protein